MELKINAYSKLKEINIEEVKIYEDGTISEPNIVNLNYHPNHPNHMKEFSSGSYYKSVGKRMKFGIETYGDYNKFKEHLAIITGYTSSSELCSKGGPVFFIELINFVDKDGGIGTFISSKLYNDFKDNYDRASQYFKALPNGNKFLIHYQNWCKALMIAKNQGAIYFES